MRNIIRLIREVEVKVTSEKGVINGKNKTSELVEQAVCYNMQAEYVLEKLAGVGKFIPISPFYLCELPDAGFVSESVWAKYLLPAILPKTDVIWLAPHKSKPAIVGVSWHVAESVCSGMLNPIGSIPELYLVTQFPTETQLRIIEKIQALPSQPGAFQTSTPIYQALP